MGLQVCSYVYKCREAAGYAPFVSVEKRYVHTKLTMTSPFQIVRGGHTYNIVSLEWNERGTSQLLVAENGQKFSPQPQDLANPGSKHAN